jgi:micrococcal nuclease
MIIQGILLFFFIVSCLLPSAAVAKTLSGKVLKVFDGDTILVRIPAREEHVRLREIDAPEVTHQKRFGQEPWGRRARDFAQSLVKGKTVRLEIEEGDERDKYHRLLAYVFIEHNFINREMVKAGNAFFYPGHFNGKHAAELKEAEEAAREKGVGVWDKKKGLRERPHEFRSRTKREEGLFPQFTHLIRGEAKKPSAKAYPIPPDKVVANKRSMVYHMPGSPGAARVSPKNRLFFDTPEEAEKAGFRRAKTGELQR